MQAMERKHTIPVSRDDLVFSVDMALRKAERFWPKKRGPGDHDRLRADSRNGRGPSSGVATIRYNPLIDTPDRATADDT